MINGVLEMATNGGATNLGEENTPVEIPAHFDPNNIPDEKKVDLPEAFDVSRDEVAFRAVAEELTAKPADIPEPQEVKLPEPKTEPIEMAAPVIEVKAPDIDEDDEVAAVHEKKAELDKIVHNRGVAQFADGDGDVSVANNITHGSHIGNLEHGEGGRKKKDAAEVNRQLMMLNQLNAYIAELDEKIRALEEDIEETKQALEDKYGEDWEDKLKRGEIDETDPLIIQLMQQQQDRADLVDKRDNARALQGEVVTARNEGRLVNYNAEALQPPLEEFRAQGGVLDAENPTPEQERDFGGFMVGEKKEASAELRQTEMEIFEIKLAGIEGLKGTPEYITAVDELIDELEEESSREKLLRSDSLEGTVLDRLRLDKFETEFADLEDSKNDPDYREYVADLLDELGEETANALLNANDTPQIVKDILIEQQVAEFSRELAELDKLSDPQEKLRQERDLVNGLSEEAKEILVSGDDTKELFEEDRFAALNTEVSTEQTVERSLSGNDMTLGAS